MMQKLQTLCCGSYAFTRISMYCNFKLDGG